jgi:hypothetical protein
VFKIQSNVTPVSARSPAIMIYDPRNDNKLNETRIIVMNLIDNANMMFINAIK